MDFEQINGVTKRTLGNGIFEYNFPIAFVTVDNNNGLFNVKNIIFGTPLEYVVEFAEISTPMGATTAEEYIDLLATLGVFGNEIAEPGGGSGTISFLSNRIIVTDKSQLTTIDPTKEYYIDKIDLDLSGIQIDLTDIPNFKLKGYDFNLSKIIYTDPQPLFIGTNVGNVLMHGIGFEISNALGSLYALTSSGASSIEVDTINYNNCQSLGYLDTFRQGLEVNTGRFGGKPSLELRGTWSGFRISTSIVRGISNGIGEPLFKAGTESDMLSMSGRFLTDINADLGTNAPFADFAPANFTQNNVLRLDGMTILRNGVIATDDSVTMLNITASDNESKWKGNEGVSNTVVGAKQEIVTEIVTPLTQDVWSDVNGTYTATGLSHMDAPANAQLRTLDPNKTIIFLNSNYVIDGNQNIDLEMRIVVFRNETSTDEVIDVFKATIDSLQGGRDVARFVITARLEMGASDTFRMQIRNTSNNSDITAEIGSYDLLTGIG